MKTGVEIIADERKRQIEVKGWTEEYDSLYCDGELSNAAACYAMRKECREIFLPDERDSILCELWPFEDKWWKPTPDDRIRELAKAGALIAAEIDRIHNKTNNATCGL